VSLARALSQSHATSTIVAHAPCLDEASLTF
jgi:hypothetical protein